MHLKEIFFKEKPFQSVNTKAKIGNEKYGNSSGIQAFKEQGKMNRFPNREISVISIYTLFNFLYRTDYFNLGVSNICFR